MEVATPKRKALERTAYHEAGHAVACVKFNRAFRHATIKPEDDSLGHVLYAKFSDRFRPDIDAGLKVERRIERLILISLMGMASERLHAGRRNWRGASADISNADHLACYLHGGGRVVDKYLEFKIAQADALAASPLFRIQVEAVAAALMEQTTLSSVEVRRICRTAHNDRTRLDALWAEATLRADADAMPADAD